MLVVLLVIAMVVMMMAAVVVVVVVEGVPPAVHHPHRYHYHVDPFKSNNMKVGCLFEPKTHQIFCAL